MLTQIYDEYPAWAGMHVHERLKSWKSNPTSDTNMQSPYPILELTQKFDW